MSLLAELKTKAEAELTTLKTDARAIEVRIEEAFNLGAIESKLDVIIKDATTIEAKVKAAYELGKAVL